MVLSVSGSLRLPLSSSVHFLASLWVWVAALLSLFHLAAARYEVLVLLGRLCRALVLGGLLGIEFLLGKIISEFVVGLFVRRVGGSSWNTDDVRNTAFLSLGADISIFRCFFLCVALLLHIEVSQGVARLVAGLRCAVPLQTRLLLMTYFFLRRIFSAQKMTLLAPTASLFIVLMVLVLGSLLLLRRLYRQVFGL